MGRNPNAAAIGQLECGHAYRGFDKVSEVRLREGVKPSGETLAGDYEVVVNPDVYDAESSLFEVLDTAEPNQAAVFHKLGRIWQAIDLGVDNPDGTVTLTMHQADAAYIQLAFMRLLAHKGNAAEVAAAILCLPIDHPGGNKGAKFVNEYREAVQLRARVDRLAERLTDEGHNQPKTEAHARVAEAENISIDTLERKLSRLNLSKEQRMKRYKIPPAE